MSTYTIKLDKRTQLGKNIYNLLIGMGYMNEEEPTEVKINERTTAGKSIAQMLYELKMIQSPYNPEFEARVKLAEREIAKGNYRKITNVNEL